MSLILFQLIVAFLLILFIILQGNTSFFLREKFFIQKRGWEKKIYWLTWFTGFLFLFLLILNLFLSK
ncbi:MAG: hypothetical protein ACPLZH_00330 [Minisyncoccales bacterium]